MAIAIVDVPVESDIDLSMAMLVTVSLPDKMVISFVVVQSILGITPTPTRNLILSQRPLLALEVAPGGRVG